VQHTLSLELPEDLYAALEKIAKQEGKLPEELAFQWLAIAIRFLTEYLESHAHLWAVVRCE
jgi:hypothetical protein